MVKVEITRQHVDSALSLAMHISPTGTEQQAFSAMVSTLRQVALITTFLQLFSDPWMME